MSGNKNEIPKYNLFGANNMGGFSFLSPYTAQGEKFSIVDGFSAITVDGINGKGEAGKENPIVKYDLGGTLDGVGQTIFVTNRLTTARRVVFSDLEDPSLSHVLYFDHRKEKPMAYFTEKINGEVDGKVEITTSQKDPNEPVVLKASTISLDDLRGAVNTIVTAFNKAENLTISEAFGADIQKNNLAKMEKPSDMSLFISLFDKYFEPTEENIKAIKSILPELPDDINPPKITAFKEGLSKSYNLVEYNGITVKNIDSANAIGNIIKGKFDDKRRVFAETKRFLDEKEDLRFSITVEEDIVVGVDATGSIFVLENSNLPRKSGGDLVKTEISPLISKFRKNLDTIKRKYRADANSQHVPSDNAVIEAEQSLKAEALRLGELYGEKDAVAQIVSSMHSIAGTIINKANNDKAGMAMAQAHSLFSLIETAQTRGVVLSSDLVKENMLTKNGSRVRQQYHSNHRKNNPLDRWEGIDPRNTNVISVVATLPMLSFPPRGKDEKGIGNFKEGKSAVFNIYANNDGGVIALDSQNDISHWIKSQSRLGRILTAIINLEPSDEKAKKELENFVNYGGQIGNKSTNFGLLALKTEENGMSHTYGNLFQEMRDMVYTDGNIDISKLSDLQKRIGELAKSSDRNERQLGLYRESVARNLSRNKLLSQVFYVVASNINSRKLVSYMNGDTSSLSGLEAYPVKSIKDSALVIKDALHGIMNVVKGERGENVIATSKQIGWNIINSQRLGLVSKNGDMSFIQTPSPIRGAEIVQSSKYEGGKTQFMKESLSFIKDIERLDISEGLMANSEEYQENKPKHDYSSEMATALTGTNTEEVLLEPITLDISSLTSMGIELEAPRTEEVIAPKEEEIEALSEEEKEEIISPVEEEVMLKDIDMNELNLAIEEHQEIDRDGTGISDTAKNQAKTKNTTKKAPQLVLPMQ